MSRRPTVTVRVEGELSLDIDERRLVSAMGRAVATEVRKTLRRGKTPTGESIVVGEDGGAPLRDTGQLIKSIKSVVKKDERGNWTALIWATGTRTDAPRLGGRNAGLLAVQIHGRRTWDRRPRNPNLLRYAGTPLEDAAAAAFDKQLEKDFRSGRARIRFDRRRDRSGSIGRRVLRR